MPQTGFVLRWGPLADACVLCPSLVPGWAHPAEQERPGEGLQAVPDPAFPEKQLQESDTGTAASGLSAVRPCASVSGAGDGPFLRSWNKRTDAPPPSEVDDLHVTSGRASHHNEPDSVRGSQGGAVGSRGPLRALPSAAAAGLGLEAAGWSPSTWSLVGAFGSVPVDGLAA